MLYIEHMLHVKEAKSLHMPSPWPTAYPCQHFRPGVWSGLALSTQESISKPFLDRIDPLAMLTGGAAGASSPSQISNAFFQNVTGATNILTCQLVSVIILSCQHLQMFVNILGFELNVLLLMTCEM